MANISLFKSQESNTNIFATGRNKYVAASTEIMQTNKETEDCINKSQPSKYDLWWKHLAAGGLAGGISRTCTAPLDRLKIFLQVHSTPKTRYGVVAALKHLYREGGVVSFWRGNLMNVMKIAPESALKLAAYEQIKISLVSTRSRDTLNVLDRFIAGSLAGAFSQTVIYPLEVLKTRLALRKTGEINKEQRIWHFATKIFKREGTRAFYRGFWPNLCGIIPYAGIDLAAYECLKRQYLSTHAIQSESLPGVHILVICGILSSTCGQLFTYPFALIRTRLQARSLSTDPHQPDTARKQIKYILQHDGVMGLYRGMLPNFFKVIPAVAISWIVYEEVRKSLGATMT